MKKKLDDLTKAKLIYSIELAAFAVVFLIVGILKITNVIPNKTGLLTTIFSIVTLGGGIWIIIDFIWALASKKRRKRICLIDKILVLPVALYMIGIDIYYLFIPGANIQLRSILIAIVFFYIAAIYVFQAIYHFYKPLPAILEEVNKVNEIPNNSDVVDVQDPVEVNEKGDEENERKENN